VRFPFIRAAANPDFNIIRHAVSIDERRAFFRQNLFGQPASDKQDIKEVWFAGVHSDVGGSYPEAESQLSKIALKWILQEAEAAGLVVNQQRKADILGGKAPYVAPDPITRFQHESLRGWWSIAEFWPKIVKKQTPSGTWEKSVYFNLGRHRWIAPGSYVHESVEQRLATTPYKPMNLPAERQVVSTTEAN
jgi:uncharacterized protein (DUF2235 family)